MRGCGVIAGVGHTQFGKLPGRTPSSLCVEAARFAVEDAGIDIGEVDAVFAKDPTSQHSPLFSQTVSEALGIQPDVGMVVDQGGASMCTMVATAVEAIRSKQCTTALVVMGDNPRTGTRPYDLTWGVGADYGWSGVAAGYAMVGQRYLRKNSLNPLVLGKIARTVRAHGASNPNAQLRRELSLDDYCNEDYVVDPLRRSDCCLVSDGGAAMVVTSEMHAKDMSVTRPVSILGYGQGHTAWSVEQRDPLTDTLAGRSGEKAFAMAGLKRSDIDVAQIYDCFTITLLMTLVSYGFFSAGEVDDVLEAGELSVGGSLPTNTSGGLLSESGMPGGQLIVEAVRQLRGEAVNQVHGASKAVVSGQGGVMHTHSTLILGRE